MLNRLIRWLARGAEIARLREALAKHLRAEVDDANRYRAELAEIRVSVDAAVNLAYANGYNAGRVIGHGEMLTHLRGDPDERVTTEMVQRRAVEMVH